MLADLFIGHVGSAKESETDAHGKVKLPLKKYKTFFILSYEGKGDISFIT